MTKTEAVKTINEFMDFLEMVINWEGIDDGDLLLDALHYITDKKIQRLEKTECKNHNAQLMFTIYNRKTLFGLVKYLDNIGLSYSWKANTKGNYWNLFVSSNNKLDDKLIIQCINMFVEIHYKKDEEKARHEICK